MLWDAVRRVWDEHHQVYGADKELPQKRAQVESDGAFADVLAKIDGSSEDQPQQVPPTPGSCPILTLDLGPLDLNLLGMRVALNEVNLLIEAIPGAGELLGNLLCAGLPACSIPAASCLGCWVRSPAS